MLSALLRLSRQSPIPTQFSRAAVEQSPRFVLADPANWYTKFAPSQGNTFAKVGSFSRSAVEQRPQLILEDPSDWNSGSWPNEDLTVPTIGPFSRASVESRPTPQLVLTNPANWFATWTPSQSLTLPVFPAVDFLSSNWNIRSSSAVPTETTSTTTETFISSTTTTPLTEKDQLSELRIPVTTRKPGEPHHFFDNDNYIQYEILDGVHKIFSNRQSFEIRYTKPNSGTYFKSNELSDDISIESDPVKLEDSKLETPINTPIATPIQTEVQTAPPLIHNSNDVNDIHTVVTVPSTILEPPRFEPQPFHYSSIQWNQYHDLDIMN